MLTNAIPVRIDDKGRLVVPRPIREAMHVAPGDVFYIKQKGNELRFLHAENPFDALAEEALEEHERGETMTLEEFAKQEGISLENE